MNDDIAGLLAPLNPSDATSVKVSQIALDAIESEALRAAEEILDLCDFCQSPIEQLLIAAMFSQRQLLQFDPRFMGVFPASLRHVRGETVYLHQQADVGPYRVDFLFVDASVPLEVAPPRLMVVECDGHDFHERTKEQARHDKKRDRFMQSHGYKVLRFTGSEIFADPSGVADEVFNELQTNDGWRLRS